MEVSEKEKSLKSLWTLGSVCSIIFRSFSILCLIASIFCLIGVIGSPFIPWAKAVEQVEANVAGDTSFTKYLSVKVAEVACVTGLLSLVVSMFICHYCDKLFLNIKTEGTPFRKDNVRLLNRIGIVSLIQALAVPAIVSIITTATSTGAVLSYPFSGANVVFGLLIFALSMVFKYGVSLQDEADTTL